MSVDDELIDRFLDGEVSQDESAEVIEWLELVAGDYQLRRGLLHLRFDGGVMVYLEAPAQFNVVSGKRFVLHHGRLSASVPPEGVGFR